MIAKKTLALLSAGSIFLLAATPAPAEIYKWVDEQGRLHFQDHSPEGKVLNLETRESSPTQPQPVSPVTPTPLGSASRAAAAGPTGESPRPQRILVVELYTVSWCPWCKKAREYFQSRGLKFTDYDIEKDSAAAARKNRLDPGKGVPFAVVNGVKIHGYSPEAYSRALKLPAPAGP